MSGKISERNSVNEIMRVPGVSSQCGGVHAYIYTLGAPVIDATMSVLLTTSHPCVRRSITIKKGNKSEEKGLNTF